MKPIAFFTKPLRLRKPSFAKSGIYFLSLLLFASLLFRLAPTPKVAEQSFILRFRYCPPHPALAEALEEAEHLRIGEFSAEPVQGSLHESPLLLSPREIGTHHALPSLLRTEIVGELRIAGTCREGSCFLGGEHYLAPGMTVTLENETAIFLVQILSIFADDPP